MITSKSMAIDQQEREEQELSDVVMKVMEAKDIANRHILLAIKFMIQDGKNKQAIEYIEEELNQY